MGPAVYLVAEPSDQWEGRPATSPLRSSSPCLLPRKLSLSAAEDCSDQSCDNRHSPHRPASAMDRLALSRAAAAPAASLRQNLASPAALGSSRTHLVPGNVNWRRGGRVPPCGSGRRSLSVSLRVVSKQAAVTTPTTKESKQENEVYDCVVVGAGISGLCTAQALATR